MYLKKVPTVDEIVQKHRVPPDAINYEIKIGIAYELSYTESRKIAETITLNHIYECCHYYPHIMADMSEYSLS